MNKHINILIIGAGPIGLYFASKCERANKDYLVLEATENIGGQIFNLYQEKEIVDIPGIESIKAIDYIHKLEKEVDLNKILLKTLVTGIEGHNVLTNSGTFEADYIVIATGLGFSKPRPLGLEGEEDCSNILYNLKDFSFLNDKKVAIFGGGDSALDWAKAISALTDNAYLIHRRTEFRGNADTIKDCKNLTIYLPYVPNELKIENGIVKEVTIKEVVNEGSAAKIVAIPVDYVLVNYGNIPTILPFNFPKTGSFLNVDSQYKVEDGIFAIGDVAQYENKKRRIAPGNSEADIVFNLLDH